MQSVTLRVRDVSVETPRTRVVHVSLEGRRFAFLAGQYVGVGLHGQPQRKPYSIACSPEEARAADAIELLIQVGADGSAGSHLGVPGVGALFDVDEPTGQFFFPPDPVERSFLFVAGGTGIAPVRAMLQHGLAAFPDARLALVYSARTPDEFAYGREMRELADEGRLMLRRTVTRADAGEWNEDRGRITSALIGQVLTPAPTLCFVCGPPALVEEVTAWLPAIGISPDRIKAEGW